MDLAAVFVSARGRALREIGAEGLEEDEEELRAVVDPRVLRRSQHHTVGGRFGGL